MIGLDAAVFSLSWIAIISLFLYSCLSRPDEAPVRFHVARPAELNPDHWQPYLEEYKKPTHRSARKARLDDGLDDLDDDVDALRIYVNGKIHSHCPADGRSLGNPITPDDEKDIDNAIERATSAQVAWSKTTFSQRRRVLKTLLRYVLDHQDDIATVCCLDSGKTMVDACFGEILVTAEKLQWTIKHGEGALAPSRRPTNLLMCYKKNSVVYEPLGVVAACVSWNYPFHNLISPVISALFAGNAIVVKPSEQTAWSSLYFTAVIRGALRACGHSPDLLQTVICMPAVADHLTSHPGLGHITFIGSRPIAHQVCASAARSLTPVTVELGGKDPAIVLDDATTLANIDDVVAILMRGTFQAAGQNCIGIERVIALPGIHDQILAKLRPLIQNLRLGSDTFPLGTTSTTSLPPPKPDVGSLISPHRIPHLTRLIDEAVSSGATLHTGGGAHSHPLHPDGAYFAPTLLSEVSATMAVAQTELFAPVLLLFRAADVTSAIALANATPYALGASVFGAPTAAATRRCVRDVAAGMVAVNDFGAYYAVGLPFGGRRASGYGRFGGPEGLRALCNLKAVCEDAWWAANLFRLRTRIPRPLRYPVAGHGRAERLGRAVVALGYEFDGSSWLAGVGRLLAALLGMGEPQSI